MKSQAYDDQLLTRYLLGELPEPESEAVDELSIADDELAARLQVIENDLVDAYVRGELSNPLLERFKSHYLSSPLRREKVAFARGLQKSLDPIVAAQETKPPHAIHTPAPAKQRSSRRGILRRFVLAPQSVWQWGLAALLLLLIATSAWLLVENRRLRNQMSQAQRVPPEQREQELQAQIDELRAAASEKENEATGLREQLAQLEQQASEPAESPSQATTEPNIVALALTPQMRGGAQITTLTVPSSADYVKIQLELEPNDFALYRAELRAQPGRAYVWRSTKLRARADGKLIAVTLRPAILKSQSYSMEIYGVSPTGASELISSYAFRVVK